MLADELVLGLLGQLLVLGLSTLLFGLLTRVLALQCCDVAGTLHRLSAHILLALGSGHLRINHAGGTVRRDAHAGEFADLFLPFSLMLSITDGLTGVLAALGTLLVGLTGPLRPGAACRGDLAAHDPRRGLTAGGRLAATTDIVIDFTGELSAGALGAQTA